MKGNIYLLNLKLWEVIFVQVTVINEMNCVKLSEAFFSLFCGVKS